MRPPVLQAHDFADCVNLPGFSEDLMRTHLSLYHGHVEATNSLMTVLASGRVPASAARELQRRLGWEYNGVRLHEAYFECMSAAPGAGPDGQTAEVIERSFGDADTWWESFAEIAQSRGIGWAMLTYDPVTDHALNTWIDEHDIGVLAGTTPLVVVDLFEHAHLRDFSTDRSAYLETFRAVLDWDQVALRLDRVRNLAPHAHAQ